MGPEFITSIIHELFSSIPIISVDHRYRPDVNRKSVLVSYSFGFLKCPLDFLDDVKSLFSVLLSFLVYYRDPLEIFSF